MSGNAVKTDLTTSAPNDMPTIEADLRTDMRQYAVTARELAYTVPNGVGEQALLRLSELIAARADQLPTSRTVPTVE